MLCTLCRIEDQAPARHANEILVQEFNKPTSRVVRLYGSGKLMDTTDPFLEWDYVGAWDV